MNKTKVILFDADGVMIRCPYYFSAKLEKLGYKNAEENLNAFFNGENNIQCLEGKASAMKMIMPYLQNFGWEETAKDYFFQQFQFEREYLNQNLILLITKLRNKGILCCLCTDQEKYRAKSILNDMNFQDIFDKCYISCHIGYRKCQNKFWTYVITDLKKDFPGIKPKEIVFFDDTKNNIDVALKFGIRAFLFTDMIQFERDMASVCIL